MTTNEALALVVTNLRLLANSIELAIGDPPAEYIPDPDELPVPAIDEEESNEEEISKEDVRATLTEISRSGKRAEVQALIHSYGANNLSDIPKEKYKDLLAKARGL